MWKHLLAVTPVSQWASGSVSQRLIVSDLEIAIASPSFASLLLSDTCGKLSYLPHSMGPPIPQFCHFHSAQAPVSKVALNRYNMITHATITKHPHVPRSPCFGDDDDHYDITMQLIYKILMGGHHLSYLSVRFLATTLPDSTIQWTLQFKGRVHTDKLAKLF